MKTALITGITGQDGAYLSKYLLEKDYKVIGITRNLQSGNSNGLSFLGVENDVELVVCVRVVEEIYSISVKDSLILTSNAAEYYMVIPIQSNPV